MEQTTMEMALQFAKIAEEKQLYSSKQDMKITETNEDYTVLSVRMIKMTFFVDHVCVDCVLHIDAEPIVETVNNCLGILQSIYHVNEENMKRAMGKAFHLPVYLYKG